VRVHDDWQLTPQRVAVHLPTGTAVLSDLHLGYDQARRRRGEAVPACGVAAALAPLAAVIEQWSARRVLIAGDLFEDGVDEAVVEELLVWPRQRGAELLGVVPGNHDRRLATVALSIPVLAGGFRLGRWRVIHGDGALPTGRMVCGHFHPAVRLAGQVRPCYLVGERQIVLPAFSRDARGGTPAWGRGYRRLVPVGSDVLDFGPAPR